MNNFCQVVYNNVYVENSPLKSAFGFAAWIRFNEYNLLFDTGADPVNLLDNLDVLALDPASLDAVVISHNHWDHAFGLAGLVNASGKKMPVYICQSSVECIRQQVTRISPRPIIMRQELSPGLWTTGEMLTGYKKVNFGEQALVIDLPQGLVILTGCSHPGILNIVDKVKQDIPGKQIYAVLGGFHLSNEDSQTIEHVSQGFANYGIQKVGPSHCTGTDATDIFKNNPAFEVVPFALGNKFQL